MPQLDLLDMSYLSKSSDQNQAELKNMYLEIDPNKGKYKYIALPMPGLSLFCDTGLSNIRCLFSIQEKLYAVAANELLYIDQNGTTTTLGTLNTSTDSSTVRAKIRAITGASDINHQLVIIDGTNGYQYNTSTSIGQFPITDSNFPQGAIDIESQDDYITAILPNSITYQWCNLSDTTTWNVLSFASKTGQADGLNALLSHENVMWEFGTQTTELATNVGDPDLPFTKNSTFLHYGCPARYTIAVNGNYYIFVSSNAHGGYSVYQTLPRIYYYNPAPVSTPPIDTQLGQWSSIGDAFGHIYNVDGHEFYELTSPSSNQTFIYDIPKSQQADAQKGAWYKRESYINGSYGRFLGNTRAFCYGKRLVGDFNSGKIYYEDSNNYTENGIPIRRQFVSPSGPTYAGGNRVIFSRLQIDVETGVGSNETFTLEKSIDNGSTWQLVNTYTVPPKGGRIYENRLGSSRYGMIFRITTTMNAKFAILGFQVNMEPCHS